MSECLGCVAAHSGSVMHNDKHDEKCKAEHAMSNTNQPNNEGERAVRRRIDRGDIPIQVGDRVEWITRKQLVTRMRDDFEDRHVCTITENGDDQD